MKQNIWLNLEHCHDARSQRGLHRPSLFQKRTEEFAGSPTLESSTSSSNGKCVPCPGSWTILRRQRSCKSFTKMDISMQHKTLEPDDASEDLCATATLFGKFKHNLLPTGIKRSPDFAQEIMESFLEGTDECKVCIDDAGAFKDSWENHLMMLE
jgi:hypothetical protein